MADKVTIYHNPRCTKSRQTLALLDERGIEPQVVEYLKTPPSEPEVRTLIKKLGIAPHDLLRSKEKEYREAGLSKESSEDEIVRAIVAHPILLERPIVVKGKRAAIGRPPESVLKTL